MINHKTPGMVRGVLRDVKGRAATASVPLIRGVLHLRHAEYPRTAEPRAPFSFPNNKTTEHTHMEAHERHGPAFSRGGRGEALTVELRGECPRHIVDMLDAVSMAENTTRTALVNKILGRWEEEERHKHSIVARVLGIKAAGADGAGGLSA